MTQNIGMIDRGARLLLSVALLGVAMAQGRFEWLAALAVVPALTALFGVCPLYWLARINTCPAAARHP